MPSVQVKDFPPQLYDQLKSYAELNHRSMAQQLIVAAEQMLRQTTPAPERCSDALVQADSSDDQARLARIAKREAIFAHIDATIQDARRRGTWVEAGLDAVELVRADRDASNRHGGGPEYDPANQEAPA